MRRIVVFPADSFCTVGAIPKQIPIAAIMQTIPITVRFPIHRKPMDFFFFMFFLSAGKKHRL